MPQPFLGFWSTLQRPIIGLSPMDGVTDFACRYIMARHGRPDVLFTEFTTAEGLFYAPDRILQDFEYNEIERPIVAQIYGHRPEDFYRATLVVCELGFDGVDINMGCPAKSVVSKNCGAKLITVPHLAREIIQATRSAIEDWVQGRSLEDIKITAKVIRVVEAMNQKRVGRNRLEKRKRIPYSVKTRIGYDSVVIEEWVANLLREHPAVISIHGRTLKQMYRGAARWDAIGSAVPVAKDSGTLIFGNGDLSSLEQAEEAIRSTGVDGVLIGRSAIGNPWIFRHKDTWKARFTQAASDLPLKLDPDRSERVDLALEHARYFVHHRGEHHFRQIRKHLVGYLSHFADAAALRVASLNTQDLQELSLVLRNQN